jgi:hypothetical protein
MCSRSAGGTQQVRGDLRRVLEVVAAQQGDPARVLRVFHRGLERPLEGDKPDESKGREENQAEPEEDRPQAARGRDQAEGDEAAGDRARNMFARPVDSAIVEARAPWSAKCSVVTNDIAAERWSSSSVLCGSLSIAASPPR